MRRWALATTLLGAWALLLAGWIGYRIYTTPGPCGDQRDSDGWCGRLVAAPPPAADKPTAGARRGGQPDNSPVCPNSIPSLDTLDTEQRRGLAGCQVAVAGRVERSSRRPAGALEVSLDTGLDEATVQVSWSALATHPELWQPRRGATVEVQGILQTRQGREVVIVEESDRVGTSLEPKPLVSLPSWKVPWSRGQAREMVATVVQVHSTGRNGVRFVVDEERVDGSATPSDGPRLCVAAGTGLLRRLPKVPGPGQRWRFQGLVGRSQGELCLKPLFVFQVVPLP